MVYTTRRSALFFPLASAALLLAGLVACGDGRPDVPPRSVLLLTLDTTRQDALGAYAPAPETPHLDALADQGITYRAAYTVTPLTQPSHTSVLTGLYPPRHGVRMNGVGALSADAVTLAEAAREAGFQTGAFIGALVLDEVFGLGQGFDRYVGPPRVPGNEQRDKIEDRVAGEVVDDALAWWEARERDRPWFAWVHVFDPHGPYEPPQPFERGTTRPELYAGEVSYTDQELGRLLDAVLTGDPETDPLVVLVADHGEAFDEHDEKTHGLFCYDTTIRIPFLIRYPDGYRAGEHTDEIVSVVDVYPTLAEAMGFRAGDVDGQSLYYRRADEDRGVYFESYMGYLAYGMSPLAGWLDAGGKYLHSSEPEFYRLDDATETENVVDQEDVRPYRDALAELAAKPALTLETSAAAGELTGALQALGYAAAGVTQVEVPHPLDAGERPSPHRMRHSFNETHRGMKLFKRGQYAQAEEVLRRVVAEAPENYFALDLLANALMHQNYFDDAVPILRRVVADGPGWAGSWYNLGFSLVEIGEREASLEPLRRAVTLAPHEEQFRRLLVDMLRDQGLDEEADTLEGAAQGG